MAPTTPLIFSRKKTEVAIIASLQQLSTVRIWFSFSLILSWPSPQDHKMTIAAPSLRFPLAKQGGIGFLFVHCFFILWEIFPRNPERYRLRSHLSRSGSLRRKGAFPVPLHRCLSSHPTESAFPVAGREGECCGLDSQRVSPDVCLRVESGCQQVMVHFVPILTAQQSQPSL